MCLASGSGEVVPAFDPMLYGSALRQALAPKPPMLHDPRDPVIPFAVPAIGRRVPRSHNEMDASR
jgi:hypothetical protein